MNVERTARTLVQLLPLVKSDLLLVRFDMEIVAVWEHAHSLDGSVKERLRVGRRAGRNGPDIVG